MDYPSDITPEQYEEIRPLLEDFKADTKPRKISLYEVLCAIFYLLRTGCQWRMMPHDFPKWATCYYYFRQWKQKDDELDESLLDQILAKLVKASRVDEERKEKTSFCIIDSQSVKNAASAKSKGYDAGKKISGIKRHIGVDTQGRPHFIHVTTADVTDRNGAIEGIEKNMKNLSAVIRFLADSGYSGDNFKNEVEQLIGADVKVVKRKQKGKFAVLAFRWIVERSFAWIEKFRRLWKNCEADIHNSEQMMKLAFREFKLLKNIFCIL